MQESSVSQRRILQAPVGDLAIHLMRSFGDMQLNAVLGLPRPLDPDRLRRALRLLMECEPVLGSRLVVGPSRLCWERRSDLDELDLLERYMGEDPSPALLSFMVRPLDPEKDPPVSALLLDTARGRHLCLKVSHLVCDGGGIKHCLEILSRIYEGLAADPAFSVRRNMEGSREIDQVLQRLGPFARLKLLSRNLKDTWLRIWPPRHACFHLPSTRIFSGEGPRRYLVMHVARDGFEMLKEQTRRLGCTLNDLLLAAFARALLRGDPTRPDHPLRLRFTADLRRNLESGRAEAVCNLSGFAYLNLGCCKGKGLEDLALQIRDATRKLKADTIGLGDWAMLDLVARRVPVETLSRALGRMLVPGRLPFMIPALLTNIGSLDDHRILFEGALPDSAYLTASVAYPPAAALSVTGFRRTLTLAQGYCAEEGVEDRIRALFDNMVDELDLGRQVAFDPVAHAASAQSVHEQRSS